MGSVNAQRIEPWYVLQSAPRLLTEAVTKTIARDKKVIGWVQQRVVRMVRMERILLGVSKHESALGETQSQMIIRTGPGSFLWIQNSASEPYTCTADDVDVIDHITGTALQVQVWEYVGEWEPVAGSYYEKTVT